MDDITSKISQVLSDPKALEQIQELSTMLGLSDTSQSQSSNKENVDEKNSELSVFDSFSSPQLLSLIPKIAPLLSDIGKEDDTTRFLHSLRPFLSDKRKEKLDEASKLIRMMRLFSLIKDTNLLDSFF